MLAAGAMEIMRMVQTGFQYLALLQFTAYLMPPHANVQSGATYDYIIVGAGTAGSVIASQLTEEAHISVLLIEAGGDAPLESTMPAAVAFLKNSSYDWNYIAEPDLHSNQCHRKSSPEVILGKMLGGSSSLDYMVYSRGHPTDYDNWAKIVKDQTWSWENVLPYFKKSVKVDDENFLKSPDTKKNYGSGLIGLTIDNRDYANNLLESCSEMGYDIVTDPESSFGYSKMLVSMGEGERHGSGIMFLKPAKDRKNLHVLKNTFVTKINFDEKRNAVGVEALTQDGRTLILNAKNEVIVSAGAINSAKLLLLSGIGPKKDLQSKKIKVLSDLPVGKNLQDHVSVMIPIAMETSMEKPVDPHVYLAPPVIGYNALDKSQKYPDYETASFYAHSRQLLYYCAYTYAFNYRICDDIYMLMHGQDDIGKMGLMTDIIHLNPKSRGDVKLKSLNPIEPPAINVGYFTNEDDIDDLVKFIKEFIPIVNTTFFRSIEAELVDTTSGSCYNYEAGSDEYWRCYVTCVYTGLNDYSGTCAMGSVVDSRLRVYGVQKLRVADASIMPFITRGHTNAPVVMIGEKAADFVMEDYKKKYC
ncbi:unnamed protein product [Chrysodeixis includens]|uniref:GMC oxidoreductase n=1 Tax=Chrysodeixis includens TaxID=689277 RepID=A0A9P0FUV2_CHRIL|nr:unnamed protein product [Chrysodeixis includens]